MQQLQKKQLEWLLVEYFKRTFYYFPNGKLIESESPDFLITLKNRFTIGLELTRFFPESKLLKEPGSIEHFSVEDELIHKVQNIFEESNKQKIFVKFLFSNSKNISPERFLSADVYISGIIKNTVAIFNKNRFNRLVIEKDLPEGIESILILNHPILEHSVWERSNNFGISTNLVEDIQFAIHKKELKLGLYHKQKLNYYWLLITTDRLKSNRNFNVSNKIINHSFSSRFQRVFIFDLIKSDVFQLV